MANPRKVLEYLGLFLDRRRADFRYQSGICLKGTQVIGLQQPAIPRDDPEKAFNAILDALEAHGLIATPVVEPEPKPEPVEEKVEVTEKPIVVKEEKPTEIQKRRRKKASTKKK